MLDCVLDRRANSRLSCQIVLKNELDGLVVARRRRADLRAELRAGGLGPAGVYSRIRHLSEPTLRGEHR